MKNAVRFSAVIAVGLITLAVGSAAATETVSPGALDRLAVVETRCPTFSWGMNGDAVAYDVVAYLLLDDPSQPVELTADREVLYTRVSGNATSWTPSAEQCFAPGGRYVWFVRAVTELAGDEVVAAGEWSAPRYFKVPVGPTAEELARALEVLKRWEAANGSGSPTLFAAADAGAVPGAAAASGTGTGSGSGSNHRKSVPTASAAIRGEHPDATGEAYGVIGTSASPDGAGLAAANLGGGPDLVLDGTVNGETDTRIWEWGIDRASSSDQVFQLDNSGAGVLHLIVEGDIAGTALRAEEVVINGSTVIDGSGAWTGAGDMLPCPGCVASSDIADGAVTGPKIAAEAVSSLQIEDGGVGTSDIDGGAVVAGHLAAAAVTTVKLADGAVTAAKLAPGAVGSAVLGLDSVGSSHIADGAVATADLALNAVESTKILNGSIERWDLADDIITSPKIAPLSILGSDLAAGVITTDKIADGAVDSIDLADGAVTSSKLSNGSVTSGAIRANAVSATHVADGSLTAADLAVGAVTGAAIASGAVTGPKIAASSVSHDHLNGFAVETSNLAPFAVTSAKIAGDAVDSARILDGSITAADVNPAGGLYASKTSVYIVEHSVVVPGWACNVAFPKCSDVNDLPLFGTYSADFMADLHVTRHEIDRWDSLDFPAGFLVEMCSDVGSNRNLTAWIVCVSVPSP